MNVFHEFLMVRLGHWPHQTPRFEPTEWTKIVLLEELIYSWLLTKIHPWGETETEVVLYGRAIFSYAPPRTSGTHVQEEHPSTALPSLLPSLPCVSAKPPRLSHWLDRGQSHLEAHPSWQIERKPIFIQQNGTGKHYEPSQSSQSPGSEASDVNT